jgi:uncharacterized protein YvpB
MLAAPSKRPPQGAAPTGINRISVRKRAGHHRQQQADPLSFALAALLITGLITIALAGWLVFALPRQGTDQWSWGTNPSASLRVLRAEQTRDAQQNRISQLQREVDQAKQALATATAAGAIAEATSVPSTASIVLDRPPLALILDAPVYKQQRSLSCESSAAAMAANFYGIGLSEERILAALPLHDNPHRGFRGDVDGAYGGLLDYGVYAEPIRQALTQWGLEVEHLSGGIDEIKRHIQQGRVVIAWITYDLQVQSPTQVTTSDGQVVTLVPYEHAVLVTGYNRDGLWVNDPFAGIQTFYRGQDFARSFSYLGNMGLVVGPPPS